MKIRNLSLVVVIIVFQCVNLFSQGELNEEKKVFFRDEKSWAFFLRNNGLGFNFRKGKRINAKRKSLWEIDIHTVKQAKEKKSYMSSTQSGGLVFGKMNFALALHFGVGFQHRLFEKVYKNGVAVRLFYTAGPVALLLKPVYYEVSDGIVVVDRRFSMAPAYPYILDKSSFFKGINETKFNPGAFVKGGVSFEYSKYDRRIAALELGMMCSGYLNEFEILWDYKTRYVFSLFVSIRWGKIIRGDRMKNVGFDDEILN